jgi:hypothetical protein
LYWLVSYSELACDPMNRLCPGRTPSFRSSSDTSPSKARTTCSLH